MLIEDIALVLVVLVVVTQLLLPMVMDWPAFWLFRHPSGLREARARKQRIIEEAQKRKIKADADRIRRH